ncbi:MAG: ribosome-binding factor A [Opitutaceae bacterium]|nr:ribosome-binding factor A [Opitutaceae bacterium]
MSNRILRINELVQREISSYLHTRYQSEAMPITITGVAIAPDLHTGKVFYSVVGGKVIPEEVARWLEGKAGEIRHEIGRRIVLKFLPHLTYVMDQSSERASRVQQLLDELGASGPSSPS